MFGRTDETKAIRERTKEKKSTATTHRQRLHIRLSIIISLLFKHNNISQFTDIGYYGRHAEFHVRLRSTGQLKNGR